MCWLHVRHTGRDAAVRSYLYVSHSPTGTGELVSILSHFKAALCEFIEIKLSEHQITIGVIQQCFLVVLLCGFRLYCFRIETRLKKKKTGRKMRFMNKRSRWGSDDGKQNDRKQKRKQKKSEKTDLLYSLYHRCSCCSNFRW